MRTLNVPTSRAIDPIPCTVARRRYDGGVQAFRQSQDSKYRSHYERRGDRATHRIASAVARKSWHWTILNLAWTVGPVTFIALQFGHYLGFGAQAPIQNFYYFAGYTLIAGALAGIASILRDAFYQPRIERQQAELLHSINLLHNGIMEARNLILQQLEPQERKIMSAYYILHNVGASPSAIETAVYDLTGCRDLTSAARRAQVFSEHGMQSRADDVYAEYKPALDAARETLQDTAPQAYALLENRLKGISPSIHIGTERGEGFIERVLAASEENDATRMTLYDVVDMLTLAFELINGRHISVLDARLKGDEAFEQTQEALDEARHHYRMAVRHRNSHIRLLAAALYRVTEMDIVIEATDATSQLIAAIEQGVRTLPEGERRPFRPTYDRILKLNEQVNICRERLVRAEADYMKKWQLHGQKLTLAMQSDDLRAAGFYIQERSIQLGDKDKLKLTQSVLMALDNEATPDEDRLKQSAMDIAGQLDDLIDMSQPEEQLAIEASNAADFGYITKGLAPKTKAGWAAIAIDAMHENRRKVSHRLARNLIVFYRLPLNAAIIELFVEQFGADGDYLRELNEEWSQREKASAVALPSKPPQLPEWSQLCHTKKGKASHA